MSQVTSVRTNPGALPGFVLSEPLLSGYDVVEDQINREYEARYVDIHTRIGQRSYEQIAADVEQIVRHNRPFRTFGEAFNHVVNTDRKLAPWVLWACLERRHPTMTIAQVQEVIHAVMNEDDAKFYVLWDAAKDLFFDPPKKKADESSLQETPTPRTAST